MRYNTPKRIPEEIFTNFCRFVQYGDSIEEHHASLFLPYINAKRVRESFPHTDTFLHFAVVEGRADVVKWLLENGANPNIRSTYGTPLHEAMLHGYLTVEIPELLLRYGANPNLLDDKGRTVMWYAVQDIFNEDIVKCLLEYGAYAYKPNKYHPKEIPYNYATETNKEVIDRFLGRE